MSIKKVSNSSSRESGRERNTQTTVPHRFLGFFSNGFTTPGINLWDGFFVLIFLVFGAWYFLGRLQNNYPIVILSGDGGNIASYAAAQDHPDWFSIDPALGSGNNTGIYATIHIPLIRFLYRFTGDYGLAYAWLVFPETFLQLLGFYILGRVLFKNRFWAFLLAFLTAMMVINLGLGEIWGVWRDALPRVTFQSLLPFILVLVFIWKDKPVRWIWLMIFTGLLVYVHPISAPAWGFAIWLGLWWMHPKNWGWKKRILVMLGLGFLFLVVLLPYAITYLSYNTRGQAADYNTVMTVLKEFSPQNLLNPLGAFGFFLWDATRRLLLPIAIAGFIFTWILKKSDRLQVKVVLVWMLGIFITSILIPLVEQLIENLLHILPIETELVRGFRYFVPLLLLFWLWPLAELFPKLKTTRTRTAIVALGIVLFGFWGATNRPDLSAMLRAVTCLSKGHLVCASPRTIDEVMFTLRNETQSGEGVLFFNQDPAYTSRTLSVRYAALRPLVYTERDNGILSYANRSALPKWLETTRQWEALRALPDPGQRLLGLIALGENLSAHYLIIDYPFTPAMLGNLPPDVSMMMQNSEFTMLKMP
jgi:hypothetical protein